MSMARAVAGKRAFLISLAVLFFSPMLFAENSFAWLSDDTTTRGDWIGRYGYSAFCFLGGGLNFPEWRKGGTELDKFKWNFRSGEEGTTLAKFYLSRTLLKLEDFKAEREVFNSFASDIISLSHNGNEKLSYEMAYYFEQRKELFNAEPLLYEIFKRRCVGERPPHDTEQWGFRFIKKYCEPDEWGSSNLVFADRLASVYVRWLSSIPNSSYWMIAFYHCLEESSVRWRGSWVLCCVRVRRSLGRSMRCTRSVDELRAGVRGGASTGLSRSLWSLKYRPTRLCLGLTERPEMIEILSCR